MKASTSVSGTLSELTVDMFKRLRNTIYGKWVAGLDEAQR